LNGIILENLRQRNKKMKKSDKMQVQQIFRGEKYEEILAI
jgi:hypothetical protein